MPVFIVKADGIISTVNKLLTVNSMSFFTDKIYNSGSLVSLITNLSLFATHKFSLKAG